MMGKYPVRKNVLCGREYQFLGPRSVGVLQ